MIVLDITQTSLEKLRQEKRQTVRMDVPSPRFLNSSTTDRVNQIMLR